MSNNVMQDIREIVKRIQQDLNRKPEYMCQWCGQKSKNPKGGACSKSPHKRHRYIKASVENKKCPATNKSRSILYRLANY